MTPGMIYVNMSIHRAYKEMFLENHFYCPWTLINIELSGHTNLKK